MWFIGVTAGTVGGFLPLETFMAPSVTMKLVLRDGVFSSLLAQGACGLFLEFSLCSILTLRLSDVASGDMELGNPNKREHVIFVVLGLGYLTHYDLS